jgi:flagellar motor switch protein FliN/FliY
MDDMLSQEEINALLRGLDTEDEPSSKQDLISDEEKDAIGEVSNISMGTAATTLFALVNQKVLITTPKVTIVKWDDIISQYQTPCVAIQIVYKEGLDGTNLLILKEDDVKIIADLMMGGDGLNPDSELNDLHLSAIGEAMNQMIGSAATSMSSMFHKKIDIAPPVSTRINLSEAFDPAEIAEFLEGDFINVSFSLQIGDLVDSEMMQLYPINFAKDIYNEFVNYQEEDVPKHTGALEQDKNKGQHDSNMGMNQQSPNMGMNQQSSNMGMNNQQNPNMGMNQQNSNMGMYQQNSNMGMNQQNPFGGMNQQNPNMGMYQQNPFGGMNNQQNPNMGMQQNYGMNQGNYNNIEVQQAQFQQFDVHSIMQQKENIDLIMDVQLEVTVELGRTHKSIKEVLEFAPGTIIELNKLSGEPIDVLVNGKIVAKGEVVVIDENFSIRVTDIIKQQGQL